MEQDLSLQAQRVRTVIELINLPVDHELYWFHVSAAVTTAMRPDPLPTYPDSAMRSMRVSLLAQLLRLISRELHTGSCTALLHQAGCHNREGSVHSSMPYLVGLLGAAHNYFMCAVDLDQPISSSMAHIKQACVQSKLPEHLEQHLALFATELLANAGSNFSKQHVQQPSGQQLVVTCGHLLAELSAWLCWAPPGGCSIVEPEQTHKLAAPTARLAASVRLLRSSLSSSGVRDPLYSCRFILLLAAQQARQLGGMTDAFSANPTNDLATSPFFLLLVLLVAHMQLQWWDAAASKDSRTDASSSSTMAAHVASSSSAHSNGTECEVAEAVQQYIKELLKSSGISEQCWQAISDLCKQAHCEQDPTPTLHLLAQQLNLLHGDIRWQCLPNTPAVPDSHIFTVAQLQRLLPLQLLHACSSALASSQPSIAVTAAAAAAAAVEVWDALACSNDDLDWKLQLEPMPVRLLLQQIAQLMQHTVAAGSSADGRSGSGSSGSPGISKQQQLDILEGLAGCAVSAKQHALSRSGGVAWSTWVDQMQQVTAAFEAVVRSGVLSTGVTAAPATAPTGADGTPLLGQQWRSQQEQQLLAPAEVLTSLVCMLGCKNVAGGVSEALLNLLRGTQDVGLPHPADAAIRQLAALLFSSIKYCHSEPQWSSSRSARDLVQIMVCVACELAARSMKLPVVPCRWQRQQQQQQEGLAGAAAQQEPQQQQQQQWIADADVWLLLQARLLVLCGKQLQQLQQNAAALLTTAGGLSSDAMLSKCCGWVSAAQQVLACACELLSHMTGTATAAEAAPGSWLSLQDWVQQQQQLQQAAAAADDVMLLASKASHMLNFVVQPLQPQQQPDQGHLQDEQQRLTARVAMQLTHIQHRLKDKFLLDVLTAVKERLDADAALVAVRLCAASSSFSELLTVLQDTFIFQHLPQQLEAAGLYMCALLPSKLCCNNPGCADTSGPSELQLVGGKSCVCGGCKTARFCSKDCLLEFWPRHKPTCKRLKQQQQQQQGEKRPTGQQH